MRVKEINELLENTGGFLDNFVIMFIGLNIASKQPDVCSHFTQNMLYISMKRLNIP